jgi:hypothetical protein
LPVEFSDGRTLFWEGLVIVDRAWIERNVGVDPTSIPVPASAFAHRAAASRDASLDDIQREIIDFDSEGSEGLAFLAFTKATGLSRFVDIPWPKGLAPTPATRTPVGGAKPLPRADVLVVTWTVDEGHALSRVLTPGKDSRNDYVPYTHNFAALSGQMSKGSPAVKAKAPWRILDDDHRRQEGRRFQVRVAPVAGHIQASSRKRDPAERRTLETDHWRGAAQADSVDRDGRGHRQGV